MKTPGIDAAGLVEAVRSNRRTKEVDPEKQFERELARVLVREVGKTLEKGFGGEEAAAINGILEEELVDRLVADGMFRDTPVGSSAGSYARARDPGSSSLPVKGRVSSDFGIRADPFNGSTRRHSGVDLSAPTGAPVQAARSGRVRFAGERGGYGNLVIIDHGGGIETWYAHLSDIQVQAGSRISARQQLGEVGQTGRATGPHLHLEVRKNGSPIDPSSFFPEIHPKSGGRSDR